MIANLAMTFFIGFPALMLSAFTLFHIYEQGEGK